MTKTFTLTSLSAFVVLAAIALFAVLLTPKFAGASAPSGLPATVATTSRPTVNTTASLVFATSSQSCSARIISTASSSVMIGFSDAQGFVPSAFQGMYQAGSTTVAYDSGQYGCGAVRMYSFATQAITVIESR